MGDAAMMADMTTTPRSMGMGWVGGARIVGEGFAFFLVVICLSISEASDREHMSGGAGPLQWACTCERAPRTCERAGKPANPRPAS